MNYIVHGVTNSQTQLSDFHFHFLKIVRYNHIVPVKCLAQWLSHIMDMIMLVVTIIT